MSDADGTELKVLEQGKASLSKKRKRVGVSSSSSSSPKQRGESIPIFTDAFLHFCREQRTSLRTLKVELNEVNERKKLKEIQREQTRLTNEKIQRDEKEIEENNQRWRERIQRIEQTFDELTEKETNNKDLLAFLEANVLHPTLRKNIEEIVQKMKFN